MYLLIRTVVLTKQMPDPDNFGDQFLAIEELLRTSGDPYLSGAQPNTFDFLLFGVIQCHCSIQVPPLFALQADDRLEHLRGWIGTMQSRFADYDRLYSPVYFAPHAPPPTRASTADRIAFGLGSIVMLVLAPVSISLIAFFALRTRRA